jgi:hypothetical protein
MAEQEQPIRRRVALKIIKLGMDTKNVIAALRRSVKPRLNGSSEYCAGA